MMKIVQNKKVVVSNNLFLVAIFSFTTISLAQDLTDKNITDAPIEDAAKTNLNAKEPMEPLKVGNVWTYLYTNARGKTSRCIRGITKTQIRNGETIYFYSQNAANSFLPAESYQQIMKEDGVYLSYPHEDNFVKQVPHMPKVGEKWGSKGKDYEETFTVSSTGTIISTPAGKFSCTVMVNKFISTEETREVKYYFSRGVGLVLTEYDDGSKEELIKYKLME